MNLIWASVSLRLEVQKHKANRAEVPKSLVCDNFLMLARFFIFMCTEKIKLTMV